MSNRCAVRTFGASALLGLPAALLAHVLVFGREHVVGGSVHSIAVNLAIASAFLAVLLGSIARIRRSTCYVPRAANVALAAAAWLAALEGVESAHAIPVLLCAAAVAFAAWFATGIVRACTYTVVAIARVFGTLAKAECAPSLPRLSGTVFTRPLAPWRFALFSRPPPARS